MNLLRGFASFFRPVEVAKSAREVLDDLDNRIAALERSYKNLRTEWEEAYEKQQHILARITKRSAALARERAELEANSAAQDATGTTNEHPPLGRPSGLPSVGSHSILADMRRRKLQG